MLKPIQNRFHRFHFDAPAGQYGPGATHGLEGPWMLSGTPRGFGTATSKEPRSIVSLSRATGYQCFAWMELAKPISWGG